MEDHKTTERLDKEMNINPPAFPRNTTQYEPSQDGLTALDYFAAAALTGIIEIEVREDRHGFNKNVAERAYDLASSMLLERERRMKGNQ